MEIDKVCIYCGSSFGNDSLWKESAAELGRLIASEGWNLVYGGGSRGLMGTVALSAKEGGSHITGYTTKRFHKDSDDEWPADDFEVFDTMHERKMRMFLESDAFIALPGGMGTMEELSELITWKQIKYTNKPFVLFNLGGYWDHFIAQMHVMLDNGFTKAEQMEKIKVCSTAEETVAYLKAYVFCDAAYEIRK